ncbi:MAG: restriction endonuclease [Candidatus Binataceae bacterium]|nr:restriction endonuclease [Candidatus Binataceae bacterium]
MLAKDSGRVCDHVLFVGPEGCGKGTIAQAVARELGVSIRVADGSTIEAAGDLAAIAANLEEGDILYFQNVNRLRRPLRKILSSGMSEFRLNIVVGKGSGSHLMPLLVKPFTCIAAVQKESDCPSELFNLFNIVVRMRPYPQAEMVQIAERIATRLGIEIEASALELLASLADGSPAKASLIIARLNSKRVTEHDVQQLLPVFGRPDNTFADLLSEVPPDVGAISGVEFERLVTALLRKMGFVAEMTRVTGDGGIDIEAQLDRPVIGGRYLFQCKRFAVDSPVGSAMVREFYGALVADRKAVKGVLITTSTFTLQAREFAAALPIELIDGGKLSLLLREYGKEPELED